MQQGKLTVLPTDHILICTNKYVFYSVYISEIKIANLPVVQTGFTRSNSIQIFKAGMASFCLLSKLRSKSWMNLTLKPIRRVVCQYQSTFHEILFLDFSSFVFVCIRLLKDGRP